MKIFFLLFAILFYTTAYSQKTELFIGTLPPPSLKSISKNEKIFGNKEPFEQADLVPEFNGDISKFKKLLIDNLDKTKFNINKKAYNSELSFIIEKDGSVSSIQATGNDKSFNTAVENAFKKMKTDWKSAKDSNWEVRYNISVPIEYSKNFYTTNSNESHNFFGTKKISVSKIFDQVEQPAVYPNGIEKFKVIIGNESFYSFKITFVVERDGSCTDVKILGEDSEKNKEIRKKFASIKEKWIPAEINGQKVRSRNEIIFP